MTPLTITVNVIYRTNLLLILTLNKKHSIKDTNKMKMMSMDMTNIFMSVHMTSQPAADYLSIRKIGNINSIC